MQHFSVDNGNLFPESMIVREVDSANSKTKVSIRLNGRLVALEKVFEMSKSGILKKVFLFYNYNIVDY